MSTWHWDACNLEERASRVKCNEGGGLEDCESKPAKNPTEELSDPYIDDFLASQQLSHGLTGLLMAITRTDNNNTVVYQVRASRCHPLRAALSHRAADVLVTALCSPPCRRPCRRGSARARR